MGVVVLTGTQTVAEVFRRGQNEVSEVSHGGLHRAEEYSERNKACDFFMNLLRPLQSSVRNFPFSPVGWRKFNGRNPSQNGLPGIVIPDAYVLRRLSCPFS